MDTRPQAADAMNDPPLPGGAAAASSRFVTHPCEVCRVQCRFQVVDARRPDVPAFITPIWPDTAWLGWTWSHDHRNLLELVPFCCQQCLVRWFELDAERQRELESVPPVTLVTEKRRP